MRECTFYNKKKKAATTTHRIGPVPLWHFEDIFLDDTSSQGKSSLFLFLHRTTLQMMTSVSFTFFAAFPLLFRRYSPFVAPLGLKVDRSRLL